MLPRHFLLALLVPVVLICVGAVGFHVIEGLGFDEALYLTVLTITTVGYGDIVPKTGLGRVFTMLLALGGVFSIFYAASAIIRGVVSGELALQFGKRQMERALSTLRNHVIVCGYGRMGRLVCREFSQDAVPFIVIDENEAALRDFQMAHGIPVVGDATSDALLKSVGIERARSLVSVMPSDAQNLYTTMSARLLNPNLFIVARVEDGAAEQKFVRAGANRVVSPYQIGGLRVAQAVLRPTVVDFIELATRKEHIDLQMEETRVEPGSPLAGKALRDTRIRAELKIIVVAIKKRTGHMVFNPDPDTIIDAGDILVAIGHKDQLDQLTRQGSTSTG
ncbi:MAG: potassium channel protein [Gemmataceae bacterium]